MNRYDGLSLSRYDCVVGFRGTKFQVIIISPSTDVAYIALQMVIVNRCVNWVILIEAYCSSIRQGDNDNVVEVNNEQQVSKNRALRNSRIGWQKVR